MRQRGVSPGAPPASSRCTVALLRRRTANDGCPRNPMPGLVGRSEWRIGGLPACCGVGHWQTLEPAAIRCMLRHRRRHRMVSVSDSLELISLLPLSARDLPELVCEHRPAPEKEGSHYWVMLENDETHYACAPAKPAREVTNVWLWRHFATLVRRQPAHGNSGDSALISCWPPSLSHL